MIDVFIVWAIYGNISNFSFNFITVYYKLNIFGSQTFICTKQAILLKLSRALWKNNLMNRLISKLHPY